MPLSVVLNSGGKKTTTKQQQKRNNVCKIVATIVASAGARTSLGPIMPLIVATTFATQPVYNDARVADALRSDQNTIILH
jgi:hypothetical protein